MIKSFQKTTSAKFKLTTRSGCGSQWRRRPSVQAPIYLVLTPGGRIWDFTLWAFVTLSSTHITQWNTDMLKGEHTGVDTSTLWVTACCRKGERAEFVSFFLSFFLLLWPVLRAACSRCWSWCPDDSAAVQSGTFLSFPGSPLDGRGQCQKPPAFLCAVKSVSSWSHLPGDRHSSVFKSWGFTPMSRTWGLVRDSASLREEEKHTSTANQHPVTHFGTWKAWTWVKHGEIRGGCGDEKKIPMNGLGSESQPSVRLMWTNRWLWVNQTRRKITGCTSNTCWVART